jgi:uncharacterized membrane protein YuzA (DUF378 family)
MFYSKKGNSIHGGVIDLSIIQKIALALTIIGALNWGLAGIFRFDVVAEMAGGYSRPVARLIYLLIGIAGIVNLGLLFGDSRDHDSAHAET